MSLSKDFSGISQLLGDAVEQLGKLVQNEAQLARAELGEKFSQASTGASYLLGAGVLAIPALVVLLIAFAMWLTTAFALSPAAAHLIAAVIGIAIAGVLALTGLSYLKPANLTPKVTIHQVERDMATAKDMMR